MFEGTLNVLITVKSIYNAHHYNMNLNITRSCCGSQFFTIEFYKKKKRRMLQRDYRNMTKKWSFFNNSFVKVPLYHNSLLTRTIPMDTKHSIIKGLHFNPFKQDGIFHLYSNSNRTICKQMVETLQLLIWIFTVCTCPTNRMLGLYGLTITLRILNVYLIVCARAKTYVIGMNILV